MALLEMKLGNNVKLNSVIGSLRPDSKRETTDGVVAYRSSHLEGVEEPEKVVRSDHGVQKDPEAILEVRRILLEHLLQGAAATPYAGPNEANPARAALVPPANASPR
jgi:hypothetical protein